MNKGFNKNAQGGFTLIELIVVIVILGILAATALPKFASLSGDARMASLKAARGAMASSASMVHGVYMMKGATPVVVEGTSVAITNGYPTADASFVAAAGLSSDDYEADYTTSGTVKITPNGMPAALKTTCYVSYTQAAANNAPTYGSVTTKCE